MKWLLTFLLAVSFFTSSAQSNQSKLSKTLPVSINCTVNELKGAFTKRAGEKIAFAFSDDFIATGVVKSSMIKYPNLQTAIIELPDFDKSIFQLSKRINADKSISYIGRIINTTRGYLYELKTNISGKYQLTKQELNKVRPTCDMLK